jgi:ribonucleoside-diphosphate reductase alpha chain
MSELIKYFNGDDLAASVWQGKYQDEGEITPDDMHKRLAKSFASIEKEYVKEEASLFYEVGDKITSPLSEYGKFRQNLTEDRIFNFFKNFKYIIPQGSVMAQLGIDSIGSLSNCFVVGQPVDSYGGIFEKDQQLAQLMKRRGGVGIDISTLRPEGTSTSNAAKTSTGAMSFMHRFSNTTREVAQNGRRGALMISTDINHPDVLQFIKAKRDLTQITGANISVKLNNEFMEAVVNDTDYLLRFPCDLKLPEYSDVFKINELVPLNEEGTFVKRVKAKEYWYEIIKSAHNVAEPGLMFWNSMVEYSPDGIYEQFRQITTNPCSEIGMQAYDACRLIAVNLFNFVDKPFTKDAKFNFDKFYEINYEAMRISDDLIDLEIQHIDRIIAKIHKDPEPWHIKNTEYLLWHKIRETALSSRRTGLGFTALGDTLAALGLKYDSGKSLKTIEKIMHIKLESELDCTTDLSILRGSFEGWDASTEFEIEKRKEEGISITEISGKNSFYGFINTTYPEQTVKMIKYGRRNVSWSTVAPTGTVSLLAQTTSGIEPLFQPFYTRRKKVNPNDTDVRVDFTDDNGDTWMEFPVLHPKFKDWMYLKYLDKYPREDEPFNLWLTRIDLNHFFEHSPWYGSTANDIDWIKRVEIQATIQKYITHSISSTINLPEDVSEETVSEIYLESWKRGLKGITVYRDGSRSGVLVSNPTSKETFSYKDAPKRPKELPAEAHVVTVKGNKFSVIVGLLDNKPYEVFIESSDGLNGTGVIRKKSKAVYLFEQEDTSMDISSEMTDEEAAITRLVSTSLRHGADIKFIVEQLLKSDGDLFSFTKGLARVLKKYIPDGAKATVTCNDCGSSNVIFEEGCHKCLDCGSSKCG